MTVGCAIAAMIHWFGARNVSIAFIVGIPTLILLVVWADAYVRAPEATSNFTVILIIFSFTVALVPLWIQNQVDRIAPHSYSVDHRWELCRYQAVFSATRAALERQSFGRRRCRSSCREAVGGWGR